MEKLNKLKKLAIFTTVALVIVSIFNLYMLHFNHFERFQSFGFRWVEFGLFIPSVVLWIWLVLEESIGMFYVKFILGSIALAFVFVTTIPHSGLLEWRVTHGITLIIYVCTIFLANSEIKKTVKKLD